MGRWTDAKQWHGGSPFAVVARNPEQKYKCPGLAHDSQGTHSDIISFLGSDYRVV